MTRELVIFFDKKFFNVVELAPFVSTRKRGGWGIASGTRAIFLFCCIWSRDLRFGARVKGSALSVTPASEDGEQQALPTAFGVPAKSEAVVSRRIGGETIVVPIKSSKSELDDIFTLNEVASRTWDLIDGRNTIAEIAAAIASEYAVSPETALEDTLKLLNDFAQARVVNLSAPGDQGE